MTTPGHGYPDYQSLPNWRSPNVYPSLNGTYPPGVTLGTLFPVSQWQAIMLRFRASSGQAKIDVNWFNDAAGTQLVGVDEWRFFGGHGVFLVLPCEAPFVRVDVNNTGLVNFVTTNYLVGTNASNGRFYAPIGGNSISDVSVSVPPSGSNNSDLTWNFAGNGYLNFSPADSSGKLVVTVQQLDETGAASSYVYGGVLPTDTLTATFAVDRDTLRLRVVNLDAVTAHAFTAYMVLRPEG